MNTLKVETKNFVKEWRLDSDAQRAIKPIADEFGFGITQFLRLFSLGALPGQGRRSKCDEAKMPKGFAVNLGENPSICARVRRAASYDGLSIEEFAWRAITSSVNCIEEDTIRNPKTGEIITEDDDVRQFCIHSVHREAK
jgi:hypothetical protein